jgi:hypothetical protein
MKIKIYDVTVSYGSWVHKYPMCACSSCGAIIKAMDFYGEHVRISAKPRK